MVEPSPGNLLLRIVYFLLIGWWLGGMVTVIAWFLVLTIIGLPLAFWLVERLPAITTLAPMGGNRRLHTPADTDLMGEEQYPLLWRALYFVFIGWWLTGVWLGLAYLALLTIILIPVAFWMFERIAMVATLYRY